MGGRLGRQEKIFTQGYISIQGRSVAPERAATSAAMADANPYAGNRAGENFNPAKPGGQTANAMVDYATPYVGPEMMAHGKSGIRAIIELKTLTACVVVGVLLLIISMIIFGVEKKNCPGAGGLMGSFWCTLVATFVFLGGFLYVALDRKKNKYSEAAKRAPPGSAA